MKTTFNVTVEIENSTAPDVRERVAAGLALLAGHEPSKPEAKAKPGATPLVTRVTFTVLRGPNHMRLAGLSPKEVRVGDLVEEVNVTHSSC